MRIEDVRAPGATSSIHVPERRGYQRLRLGLRTLVDLGEGQHSLVLDIGEGGLALEASFIPKPQIRPIRLALVFGEGRLELNGRIAWARIQETARRRVP